MRQRRVKNLEAKYAQYEDILIRDPAAMKGRWQDRSLGRPVYVEIGCGKGKFISELAARESDHFFVAIEGNMSVMLRAMEKVRAKSLNNVVFVPVFAEDFERLERKPKQPKEEDIKMSGDVQLEDFDFSHRQEQ